MHKPDENYAVLEDLSVNCPACDLEVSGSNWEGHAFSAPHQERACAEELLTEHDERPFICDRPRDHAASHLCIAAVAEHHHRDDIEGVEIHLDARFYAVEWPFSNLKE